MKKYRYILGILVVFTLLAGCGTQTDDQELFIKTVVADNKRMETFIDIAGVLAPIRSENISAKMSGIVKEINVAAGQDVHAGVTLVVIDTKELEAQLAQAEAAYNVTKDQAAIAKSNLEAAQAGTATAQNSLNATRSLIDDQISQAELSVDSAQKSLDAIKEQNKVQLDQAQQNISTAQDNYDRIKQLYNAGIASKTEFDNAERALDSAKTQYSLVESSASSSLLAAESKLESAQNSYNQAKGSLATSQIVAAESNITGAQSKVDTAKEQYAASSSSTLEQAQAAINMIEIQLSNATITSPSNGVVVNKNISAGEFAQAGAPLVTVADMSKLILKGTISQEAIPYIKEGQTVDVQVDIFPDNILKGTVESVGPMAVSTGSYFPVEVSIDNADKSLFAGISAHASINIAKDNSVVVPSSSVVENDGQTYVYVIENGLAVKRTVVVGLKNAAETEILRGLSQGETVAASNVNTLLDKMPVQIQE